MTDEIRLKDPVAAVRALPQGAAVILRHTDKDARALLARRLKPIVRARGLLLLISGDAPLAAGIGADGLHLPELRAREAAHFKGCRPSWLITVAAHSLRGLAVARRSGADAAILAPVFATASHRDRVPLGPARVRMIAAAIPIPVYALGGVDARNAGLLKGAGIAGIAAIGALAPGQSE
jgi:thiamine-phosphate pyrophosphorylase